MGRRTSGTVRSADESDETATDTGSRKHLHQRNQKHPHHRRGSDIGDSGRDDSRDDAGGAIHHRATEQPRGTTDELPLHLAGCENQLGTHQRDSWEGQRGKQRKGIGLFHRHPKRLVVQGSGFQVRPASSQENDRRYHDGDTRRKDYRHRRCIGKRKDHPYQTDVGVLSCIGRRNPYRFFQSQRLQSKMVAQTMWRGDAGRGYLLGKHRPEHCCR